MHPNCVIDRSIVGPRNSIGPFARLRPESVLHEDVHIGNFVEVKKSEIGAGSKANHLTYLGDATVGSKVNVGAGTVTVNYDGVNKWRTEIGDGAFVGSGLDAGRAGQRSARTPIPAPARPSPRTPPRAS